MEKCLRLEDALIIEKFGSIEKFFNYCETNGFKVERLPKEDKGEFVWGPGYLVFVKDNQ